MSHAHGDHISYGSLRVLARAGLPVCAEGRVIRQLRNRHCPEDWAHQPKLRQFPGGAFELGDFGVMPIEVPHAPGYPTFGFVIRARHGTARRKIVVSTDLRDPCALLPHLIDADFIFIEANHDLALLRQHPNPASRFHLNNVETTRLLCQAVLRAATPPRAVMLGHLSEERNSRRLAIDEVRKGFAHERVQLRFDLDAAPAHKASPVIEV